MASTYPTPNYENLESRADQLIISSAILLFLGALAVALRLWAHISARIWAVDDIFIVLAWLSALGLAIVLNLSTRNFGFSRHIWDVKVE